MIGEDGGLDFRRLARLGLIGLGGAALFAVAMVGPAVFGLFPTPVREHPADWALAALVVGYLLARLLAVGGAVGRAVAGLDRLADRALGGGLAAALTILYAVLYLTWMPHYLTWPWSRDLDTFAVLAQGWDAGIRPYRDVIAYNLPGQTYLFWLLGQVVGWGHPWAIYAIDAALVAALGVLLAAWSRRRLGGPLPGLVGYGAFLFYYLGLNYELVAQRDWHAMFLVVAALIAAEGWPGRRGRVASALAVAAALTVRPHVVLFLPALASAVDEGAGRPGEPGRRPARALLEWAAATAAFTALAYAPLFLAGIADDLLDRLRIPAYGGAYGGITAESFRDRLTEQLADWRRDALIGSALLLLGSADPGRRRLARTWSLAWAGALLYRPLHPMSHAYLAHPLLLVGAVGVALPVGWLLARERLPGLLRVVATLFILHQVMPDLPRHCLPRTSLEAPADLVRGREPVRPPTGGAQPFPEGPDPDSNWNIYRRVLAYLRRATGPRTSVANLLNRYPFESLNGPTGRPSPFRAESGICWLCFVRIDLDAQFADELERTPDSVVVWEPAQADADPRMPLPRTLAVVRRLYEPEARFGPVEVWRRRPAPAGHQARR